MYIKSILLLAWTGIAAASPALAVDPADAEFASQQLVEMSTQAPSTALVSPTAVPGDETALLSDSELGEIRGGEVKVVSNQTLVAITSGNVINGNYTAGNVTLSDNALSNFTGVGNLVINTGGQVSLQSGMNLTINVGN